MKRFLCIVLAGTLSSPGGVAADDDMLSIGSGNTVGNYYATSSAVAKLFNYQRATYGQWAVTVASEGARENINNVLDGQVEFGFAEANSLDKATRGLGPWAGNPHGNLRAVFGLYTEALTIVAAQDAKIFSLQDLKGKRVNIGAPGSSTQEGVRRLLQNAGIELDSVEILEQPESHCSDLLVNRKIEAYFFTVGHPTIAVRDTGFGKRPIRLIPLDESGIQAALRANPGFSPAMIPIDYYPEIDNSEPVTTIGVRAVFFTRADVPEETVYRIVKEVMVNFDLFRRQQPVLADLKAGEMAQVAEIPMHPGAIRYFQEAGLLK